MSNVAEIPQTDVEAAGSEVRAVGFSNAAQLVYSCNESTDEEKIDKCNEIGRVFGAGIEEQGPHRPCCTQNRDDEQGEDRGRRQAVGNRVGMHKPCEHP